MKLPCPGNTLRTRKSVPLYNIEVSLQWRQHWYNPSLWNFIQETQSGQGKDPLNRGIPFKKCNTYNGISNQGYTQD